MVAGVSAELGGREVVMVGVGGAEAQVEGGAVHLRQISHSLDTVSQVEPFASG